MNRTVARHILAMIGAGIMLGGCSKGQPPFRMIELCLAGPQEVPLFVSLMDSIAQEHQMEFGDRSGQAEAELRAIGNKNVHVAHPHVNIWADQNSKFRFSADNLGLPTREMAIGFNGNDPEAARQFANAVVAQLSKRWHIYEVPKGRGALPLPYCNQELKQPSA